MNDRRLLRQVQDSAYRSALKLFTSASCQSASSDRSGKGRGECYEQVARVHDCWPNRCFIVSCHLRSAAALCLVAANWVGSRDCLSQRSTAKFVRGSKGTSNETKRWLDSSFRQSCWLEDS